MVFYYQQIKKHDQRKNLFYKKYLKPHSQERLQAFSQIQEQVWLAIGDSKKTYYEKLSNKHSNECLIEIFNSYFAKQCSFLKMKV